jgi:hypothetical protein
VLWCHRDVCTDGTVLRYTTTNVNSVWPRNQNDMEETKVAIFTSTKWTCNLKGSRFFPVWSKISLSPAMAAGSVTYYAEFVRYGNCSMSHRAPSDSRDRSSTTGRERKKIWHAHDLSGGCFLHARKFQEEVDAKCPKGIVPFPAVLFRSPFVLSARSVRVPCNDTDWAPKSLLSLN